MSKLENMTEQQKKNALELWHSAPDNAFFDPATVALVMCVSTSLLQLQRCTGNGIPYHKPSARRILYKKADVIAYIESRGLKSTSQKAAC